MRTTSHDVACSHCSACSNCEIECLANVTCCDHGRCNVRRPVLCPVHCAGFCHARISVRILNSALCIAGAANCKPGTVAQCRQMGATQQHLELDATFRANWSAGRLQYPPLILRVCRRPWPGQQQCGIKQQCGSNRHPQATKSFSRLPPGVTKAYR